LRRVKRHSAEHSILQTLNRDETRDDPWNPAPNLLYAAERADDDVVLCFERLFDCDDPPLRTVANVIDYIRQALEVSKKKNPPKKPKKKRKEKPDFLRHGFSNARE
jgi:hypothetical protein